MSCSLWYHRVRVRITKRDGISKRIQVKAQLEKQKSNALIIDFSDPDRKSEYRRTSNRDSVFRISPMCFPYHPNRTQKRSFQLKSRRMNKAFDYLIDVCDSSQLFGCKEGVLMFIDFPPVLQLQLKCFEYDFLYFFICLDFESGARRHGSYFTCWQKVLIASGSNNLNLPDDSTIDAPLAINVRSSKASTAPSDSSLTADAIQGTKVYKNQLVV